MGNDKSNSYLLMAQCKECTAECFAMTKNDLVGADFNKLGIKCNSKFKKVTSKSEITKLFNEAIATRGK